MIPEKRAFTPIALVKSMAGSGHSGIRQLTPSKLRQEIGPRLSS